MNTDRNTTKVSIGGRLTVCPNDVIMLQANINYSMVYLADGKQLLVATTLKKLEERFSDFAFVRMNKTYMINTDYIIEVNENSLKLSNSLTITFSRRKGKKWKEYMADKTSIIQKNVS
ncbi:LytTr DNA-binding region (plasmid) [Emticicia oligotrophica DSM 17448]|uniref:LytTr DNA-binding region n=1 Tax=Emticicia oligotrophica (strain DSM 17448 / CIP 109782 / MTCC 6937 / GPTSA100-15) TaxID=929562 RepID=A0ABM5N855_EMTOG|nr:LytTR family DNA-binding domain-containing protein [Emticicia oligotrophica]AFK05686.1 LytTr DNA-binding region [Emticicia oligotrophica DSM 17448]